MKKIICVVLAAAVLFALAACGTENKATETTGETVATETTTAAETEAAATTGSSGKADMEALAGEYVFYGTYMGEYYVTIEELAGTSTQLKADGTGYLNWGEANEGPINKWSVKDQAIAITSGETSISGMIGNGILMLQIGDEDISFLECYVREDADTSQMPQITAEEWAKQITESME